MELYYDPADGFPAAYRKLRKGGPLLTLLLICRLVSSAVGAGIVLLFTSERSNAEAEEAFVPSYSVTETAYSGADRKMTATEIYAKYADATVGVTTSVTTNLWGRQTTSATPPIWTWAGRSLLSAIPLAS